MNWVATTDDFSPQTAAPSSTEAIDKNIDIGEYCAGINISETLKDVDSDSATETEDESEYEKGLNRKIPNEGETNDAKGLPDANALVNDGATAKRKQCLKLEDVRSVDILFPNRRNSSGVKQAKIDLNGDFICFRKVIDIFRPVFMKCNTSQEKLKVAKFVVDKVMESGGSFLRENGNGNNSVCEEITLKDRIGCTIMAFEDEKPWTAIASSIEGIKDEDQPFAKSLQGTNLDYQQSSIREQDLKGAIESPLPQHLTPSIDASPPETLLTAEESLALGKSARIGHCENKCISPEPHLKKAKTDCAGVAVPRCLTSTSNLHGNSAQNAMENASESARINESSSLAIQSLLKEREVIRGELTQNQDVLSMRHERVARLEKVLKAFLDHQPALPSVHRLTEKILRQVELFENRELLGIQHKRCRSIKTLLELNERQMFEQQSMIEKEKLKQKTWQSILEHGVPHVDVQKMRMDELITGQDTRPEKPSVKELIDIDNNNRIAVEAEIRKQMDFHLMIDEHFAVEVERNRRVEQKTAIEQDIKDRLSIEDAVKRQSEMQQAMKVMQSLMTKRKFDEGNADKGNTDEGNAENSNSDEGNAENGNIDETYTDETDDDSIII